MSPSLAGAASERVLIVNADDFGQSHGINRGVVRAHEGGVVTSASLMVRWPAASEAAAYARAHPDLSLGLHVDLGEWTYRAGSWEPRYLVADWEDAGAVRAAVDDQVTQFRQLTGRDPTHLDSHQHAHRTRPARTALLEWCERLGVPVRHFDRRIRYSGAFYGQTGKGEPLPEAIAVDALLAILEGLEPGVTELGCHPGDADGEDHGSMYALERRRETETLCDPRVRAAIDGLAIRLANFVSPWSSVEAAR